ncbi:hypothetical protein FO519_006388 [Halicephalobus sp. NKZ332]|nr:hypothetical protein FO519_006388 [Halicephalobus sp. NKZ332]
MIYLATVTGILAIYLLIKWMIFEKKKYPPGPPRLPFLGNIFQVDQAYPHRSFVSLMRKYGPIFTVWLPGPTVVLSNFEILKETNSAYPLQTSGRPQEFLYGIFSKHQKNGDGIILCQGEKWISQRRFALKTFHNFGMGKRIMESKINYHKNLLLKRLSGFCDTETGKGVVDLHLHIGYCVGNIINDLVMGRFYHFGEPEFLKFKKLIDNTLEGFASASMQLVNMYPFLRFFVPYYKKYVKEGFEIQKFFLEEIEKHEAAFDEGDEPTNFIDAYLSEIKKGKEKNLNKLTLALDAGDLWTGGMETTEFKKHFNSNLMLF